MDSYNAGSHDYHILNIVVLLACHKHDKHDKMFQITDTLETFQQCLLIVMNKNNFIPCFYYVLVGQNKMFQITDTIYMTVCV